MFMTDQDFLDIAKERGITLDSLDGARSKARRSAERGDALAFLAASTLDGIELALRRKAGEDVAPLRQRIRRERFVERHGWDPDDLDAADGADAAAPGR